MKRLKMMIKRIRLVLVIVPMTKMKIAGLVATMQILQPRNTVPLRSRR